MASLIVLPANDSGVWPRLGTVAKAIAMTDTARTSTLRKPAAGGIGCMAAYLVDRDFLCGVPFLGFLHRFCHSRNCSKMAGYIYIEICPEPLMPRARSADAFDFVTFICFSRSYRAAAWPRRLGTLVLP